MWLLSTDRAELHYFARSFDAVGGYAILSHTWDGNEQTLQQVCAIAERCRANSTNPREDPELSSKIRECCILAEKHGYRWVWIDSCCIDKTSSSELSEAINSMYKWYKASEVCYAYLVDVPSGCDLHARKSAFRKSRWHTRGWTLQELIAPDSVIFLSIDWRELGNRAELAGLLREVTRVPFGVLTGKYRPAQYSVSARMSWASRRKTMRVEDEAYSLMGLFGVCMPTNYGEDKRAFIRLQYEIMQHQTCDMTLFAFGYSVTPDNITHGGMVFVTDGSVNRENPWRYLLADSPRQFLSSFGYIPDLGKNAKQQYPPPLDSTTTGPFDGVELPNATVTSYGVQFRLPVATVDGTTVAVTLCRHRGRHFGLFLNRDAAGKDPTRPRYFIGCRYTASATGSARYLARMCDLGDDLYNLTFNGKPVEASWRTIYVVLTASHLHAESVTSPNLIINCNPASRFRLPRWLVDRFITLGFGVDQFRNAEMLKVVTFSYRSRALISVSLGSCTGHHNPENPLLLWAKVDISSTIVFLETSTHDCSQDHIDSESWATRSKDFGNADRRVRLSFTPSTRMPETTLVIHLELFGRIFEEMLREAGVSFPSLADLKRDTSYPTPNAPVQTPSRPPISLIALPTSSSTSATILHPRLSRILSPLSLRGLHKLRRGVLRRLGRREEDARQHDGLLRGHDG